jgi:hypothetical protein
MEKKKLSSMPLSNQRKEHPLVVPDLTILLFVACCNRGHENASA